MIPDLICTAALLPRTGEIGGITSEADASADRTVPVGRCADEVEAGQHLVEEGRVSTCSGDFQSIEQFLVVVHIVRVQIDAALLLFADRANVTQVESDFLRQVSRYR